MYELIVQSGKHQGKCLSLPSEGEVIIGRDELCQIRLASSDVSRHHCVLKVTSDGLVARDLDSRNGTYLNETLMEEETLLKPGDTLRIGPIVLQVPGAPAPKGHAASDDDIADWLSTNEKLSAGDGSEAASGDTTIIPRPAALDPPPAPAAPTPRDAPRHYRSVADEAAEIIRRHWEMVKAQRDQD
jgi:pSer/pThr/pTyr-binding forkhead associated (FHA) protein